MAAALALLNVGGKNLTAQASAVASAMETAAALVKEQVAAGTQTAEDLFTELNGLPVSFSTGYRDQGPATWSGRVEWVKSGTKDQLEIGLVGQCAPLAKVKIVQSWEDETAENIIRDVIGQTGMSPGDIGVTDVTIPRFTASGISPFEAARAAVQTCQRAAGLDMSKWAMWRTGDGMVNWGDFDESGDVPEVATLGRLIAHKPAVDRGGLGRVESFLLPGLRHSQLFQLADQRRGVSGEFRVQAVRHRITGEAARSFVFYGAEHVRV